MVLLCPYYLRVAPNACQTFTDACGLIELNPEHRSHVLPRARESEALQALPELRQYNPGFCASPLECKRGCLNQDMNDG